MLAFADVALRRGRQLLFTGATFTLFRGEKVGLTGENGSGKSSLLALVRGELAAEAGSFDRPSNLVLAHVAQEVPADERAAIEFVLDGDTQLRELERSLARAEAAGDGALIGELHAHYAAAGGYDARARAAQLMHGLGFGPDEQGRSVASLSGGWRVRLALAQALMCPSDLLLLDEPTNHLDLDAILWLERWLIAYAGTLLLISHDRDFLDRCVERIVHLGDGTARAWRGNYSEVEVLRAAEQAQQAAMAERTARAAAHIQSFVDRFRAQASKARQVQSRLKALERLPQIAQIQARSAIQIRFADPAKLPRPLLVLERVAAAYGDGAPILTDVTMSIAPGDRIALLGRNGAGKSTLMKLLAGRLAPRGGERVEAPELRIGYFAQHQLEQLETDTSALTQLRACEAELLAGTGGARASEQALRDHLAGFGFTGERVFEPVGPFSGGEKARLALALIAWRRPNLLLLDEPTNHLDLDMRTALATALLTYAGAVVFVSHDRHLLRALSDEFWLVEAGRARRFDGDLEDYAARLAAPEPVASVPAADNGELRRQRRRDGAAQRQASAPLRRRLEQLERQLATLTEQRTGLERRVADPQLHERAQREALTSLLREQARVSAELERVESQWLEVAAELEALGGSA